MKNTFWLGLVFSMLGASAQALDQPTGSISLNNNVGACIAAQGVGGNQIHWSTPMTADYGPMTGVNENTYSGMIVSVYDSTSTGDGCTTDPNPGGHAFLCYNVQPGDTITMTPVSQSNYSVFLNHTPCSSQ